jgi:hypothetical protein
MVLLLLIVCAGLATGEVRRALVIGISDYPNYAENDRLRFAHIDAERFGRFLESDRAENVKVTSLTNGDATRGAIEDAVMALRDEQPKPDTLFVFFSGHAELDPLTQQLYLMPYDGDKKHLGATGIPASIFVTNLKATGATSFLLFVDACHSGAVLQGKGENTSNAPGESVSSTLSGAISRLNKGSGDVAMTFVSASASELSWEDEDAGQGIFTRYLLKGLEGEADGVGGTKDGKITAGELKAYLEREVPDRARALRKPVQTPFISPEFKSDYVLAITAAVPPAAVGTKSAVPTESRIHEIRLLDTELGLMLHAGAVQMASVVPSSSWSPLQTDLRTTFDMARLRKVGSLLPSFKLESLISPVITSDGTLLVACSDPASLVWISLASGEIAGSSPLDVPYSGSRRKQILDSCDISVSRDNRFALTLLRTEDGMSQLTLTPFNRGQTIVPVKDFESGRFVNDALVLSKGKVLTVLSPPTWTTLLMRELDRPAKAIVGEADSVKLGVQSEDGTIELYGLDTDALSLTRIAIGRIPRDGGPCIGANTSIFCDYAGTWSVTSLDGGMAGSSGCPGALRLFPSASEAGWQVAFQCTTESNSLRLMRDLLQSPALLVPEPILAARLRKNGQVDVVGLHGGVYAADSVRYGDCCSIPVSGVGTKVNVAAGTNGMTAVFVGDGSDAVEIFRMQRLVRRIVLPKDITISEMAWSESSRTLVLAAESHLKIVQFHNSGDDVSTRDLECGFPAAVDERDLEVACLAPETGRIQLRNITTGKLEREFDQHNGPIQAIAVGSSEITVAGTYKGQSKTVVTVWNAASGKVVSQRTCQLEGNQPLKPFAFLQRGNYFAQLDTPRRLLVRDSLTCETLGASSVQAGGSRLPASSAGTSVAFQSPNPGELFVLSALDSNGRQQWNFDLPIDTIAISPDGLDTVVVAGGRVLRIPITPAGFLNLTKRRIPREFSTRECEEFFSRDNCPKFK